MWKTPEYSICYPELLKVLRFFSSVTGLNRTVFTPASGRALRCIPGTHRIHAVEDPRCVLFRPPDAPKPERNFWPFPLRGIAFQKSGGIPRGSGYGCFSAL